MRTSSASCFGWACSLLCANGCMRGKQGAVITLPEKLALMLALPLGLARQLAVEVAGCGRNGPELRHERSDAWLRVVVLGHQNQVGTH